MYRADETAINRGNVNIFAQLGADATKNGTSDPFTVHPGTLSRVQLVLPGETSIPGSVAGVTGSPATQAAGQAFNVAVFATDAYWNQVPNSDQVRITSSDPWPARRLPEPSPTAIARSVCPWVRWVRRPLP